jgi:hypothetical protein
MNGIINGDKDKWSISFIFPTTLHNVLYVMCEINTGHSKKLELALIEFNDKGYDNYICTRQDRISAIN